MATKVSAFGKDKFEDYFKRLEYRYNKFTEDPVSFHEAEAFSIMANQLYKDWIKHFFPSDYLNIQQVAKDYIKFEIEVIREIADGIKHIELSKPPHKQLKNQGMTDGTFDYTFDFTFDTPMLVLTLQDDQQVYFAEVADKIFDYWKNYFVSNSMI